MNNSSNQPQMESIPEYIGLGWLESNGTIVLRLRAQQGSIVGHATFNYPVDHQAYKEILSHFGWAPRRRDKICSALEVNVSFFLSAIEKFRLPFVDVVAHRISN